MRTAPVKTPAQTSDEVLSSPSDRCLRGDRSEAEFDFLLACGRSICSEFVHPVYEVDPERALRLAEYHRVIPRLHSRVNRWADSKSSNTLRKLNSRFDAIARQNLLLTSELIRIVQRFDDLNIPVLPYKGPALSQSLYGDLAARQFGDLDLLIRPVDFTKASGALVELGYAPKIQLPLERQETFIASGYELGFSNPKGAKLVELKWGILPRFYRIDFKVDDLFARSQEVELAGSSLRTLSAEDSLLVLCVHAAKHWWTQLSFLCDIAQAIRGQELDWDYITDQALELGIRNILTITFLMCEELLGTPAPDSFWQDRRTDGLTSALTREAIEILRSSREPYVESWGYFRFQMRLRERLSDRALFLWRLATTPSMSDWASIRLPRLLFPLYRGVRLGRLAGRVLRAAPRRAKR